MSRRSDEGEHEVHPYIADREKGEHKVHPYIAEGKLAR
jgi:hypothetical protein